MVPADSGSSLCTCALPVELTVRLRASLRKCWSSSSFASSSEASSDSPTGLSVARSRSCEKTRLAYAPPRASSSLWVPCSMRLPWDITQMLCAFWMVESLWAMVIVVRFVLTLSSACCTILSALGSNALVASSSSRIGGLEMMLLAMAIRCF